MFLKTKQYLWLKLGLELILQRNVTTVFVSRANRVISDGRGTGVRTGQKISGWDKTFSSGFSGPVPRVSEPSIGEETEVALSKGKR